MWEKALEVASRITQPIPAAVFALAVGCAFLARYRNRKPLLAWLVFAMVLILGLAPLAASTLVRTRGLYHIRVVVLSPDGRPVDDAVVSSSAGGEIKKANRNWEYDLPPQAVASGGTVTLFASIPNAYLEGRTEVKLGDEFFPTATIRVSAPPSVEIRGVVVDADGHSVAGAGVAEVGYPGIAKTDAMGNFSLAGHGAEGQMVQVRAEKGGLSASVSVIAGKAVEIVLR